jgi:hypothetical protein
LTTLVDNIDHIEATTVNGTRSSKSFYPTASVDRANPQVTAASQSILLQLPPLVVNYTASSVSILRVSLSGRHKRSGQRWQDASALGNGSTLSLLPNFQTPPPFP